MQNSAGQSRDCFGCHLGIGGQIGRAGAHKRRRTAHYFTYLESIAPANDECVRRGPEQAAWEELVTESRRVVIFGHERYYASFGYAVDFNAFLVAPRDQVMTPFDATYEAFTFVQYTRLTSAHEAALNEHELTI